MTDLIADGAFIGVLAQADSEALLHDELTSGDWIKAGIVLVATVVLAISVSKILRRTVSRGIGHGFAAILTSRFLGYAVFIVGLSYALTVLGVRVGPLLGALGLGGLVLALALQGVVGNFVSSLILQTRRPYTVGDTVELDGGLGVVEDIDSRTTQIRGLDGTHIRIPNANVAAATIVNLTRETGQAQFCWPWAWPTTPTCNRRPTPSTRLSTGCPGCWRSRSPR